MSQPAPPPEPVPEETPTLIWKWDAELERNVPITVTMKDAILFDLIRRLQ